jgi:Leucine-rich repeat (LRR) protein
MDGTLMADKRYVTVKGKSLKIKVDSIWWVDDELRPYLPPDTKSYSHFSYNKKSRKDQISDIREIEGLENINDLNELWINNQNITRISNLEHFPNLLKLNLGSNQISKIEGLEKLTNLKFLSLASNQISKIEGLENLTKLTTLEIIHNPIRKIEGLEKLINLEKLYIGGTQIAVLEGLENLERLNFINIGQTPLLSVVKKEFEMDGGTVAHPQELVARCREIYEKKQQQQQMAQQQMQFQQQQMNVQKQQKISQTQKIVISPEKRQQLKDLLSMSNSIQINDISGMLEIPRPQVFKMLIEVRKVMPSLKIEGDLIILTDSEMSNFTSALDNQFDDWGAKERSKVGKIEEFDTSPQINIQQFVCPNCQSSVTRNHSNCPSCNVSLNWG